MKFFASVLISLLVLSVQPSFATIYRCMINGKMVFSDRPCSTDKDDVVVWDKSKTKQISEDEQNKKTEKSDRSMKKTNLKFQYEILDDDIINKKKEIKEKKEEIEILNHNMNIKLEILKNKKGYANNNLAGATWENSISREMEAVTSEYENKIDIRQKELDRLYVELEKLELELKERIDAI